jgi:hypothetical protein
MLQNVITWGRRLYFSPKEGVLRISIALEIHRPSGLEPANLGSSGKHDNCYTTEED